MFENLGDSLAGNELDQTLQLLQELERNKPDELRSQRMHVRRQIAAPVTIRPANSSCRAQNEVHGSTVDLSEGGCQIVSPQPCGVGDVYFLDFDQNTLDLPKVFARCLRCRLINEESFEVGFSFFKPIALPRQLLE